MSNTITINLCEYRVLCADAVRAAKFELEKQIDNPAANEHRLDVCREALRRAENRLASIPGYVG